MYRLMLLRLGCFLLTLFLSAAGSAQSLTLSELLEKMHVGVRAEGLSYRLQGEVYRTKSLSPFTWDPGLYSGFDVITDGTRVRKEEHSQPSDFGENPHFQNEETGVYDGEIYKTLVSSDSRPQRGTIAIRERIPLEPGAELLVGKQIVSFQEEGLLNSNVLFDATRNLYKIETMPENGGHAVFWIDPTRAYKIIRLEYFGDGTLRWYDDVELEQTEEGWIPKSVRHYDMDGENPVLTREMKVVALELNPSIDPATFELEFPEGIDVLDYRDEAEVARRVEEFRQTKMNKISREILDSIDLPSESNDIVAQDKPISATPVPDSPIQPAESPSADHSVYSFRTMYCLLGVAIPALVMGAFWLRKKRV